MAIETMPYSGIYAITDDFLLPQAKLLVGVEAALAGGVALIQYRSKINTSADRLTYARKLLELCKHYDVPLIINDDVSLCASIGAAGVHLGREDDNIEKARQHLGETAIIGITCHDSIELAVEAEKNGASYVAFGRFFPSRTKPDASAADLRILTQARAMLSIPIVAIGGINAENGAAVLRAGAHILAVINALFGSETIHSNTKALVSLCDKN